MRLFNGFINVLYARFLDYSCRLRFYVFILTLISVILFMCNFFRMSILKRCTGNGLIYITATLACDWIYTEVPTSLNSPVDFTAK